MASLDTLLEQAKQAITAIKDLKALDQFRIQYLGKKGLVTEHLHQLRELTPDEKKSAGLAINTLKQTIETLIAEKQATLKASEVADKLAAEAIDITLDGRGMRFGSLHPITQTFMDLRAIFTRLGFTFMEGPEIEQDYYNFTALNVPPLHPARAMQDTFYFADDLLLRSQMSPVQIHALEKGKPPIRMVAMGRVYRRDFDLTHTPMFHQMECLVVDEKVTFSDLKGLMTDFLKTFFDTNAPIRFRPSYFPFTEPSAEVDIGCFICDSKGCRVCKNTGWLEVLGCGMVHPNVLKGVNIDPEKYRGFASGAGIDRLAMLKYGISDLRTLFENDLRFLKQF